jgi:hypothetical protein
MLSINLPDDESCEKYLLGLNLINRHRLSTGTVQVLVHMWVPTSGCSPQ